MKVKEFLAITDPAEIVKVQQLKKFIEKRGKIGKYEFGEIIDLSYSDVDEIKETFVNGNILDLVTRSLGCDYNYLKDRDYKEFVYYLAYIEAQVLGVLKMEEDLNAPDDDDDGLLELCGIEKLAKYGSLTVIDTLAGGNILKWKEVEKLPYKEVYVKLKMDKEKAAIQRAYTKLKTRKK